ncbi:MAG: aldose 1-epimerase family protein [Atopobiaceae bacterium]|jgi:hypothetical protein|nr:aldose 1-epimerase family protein [Atopobiaceae bacterium]MCI2206890.1 aldose 1-epimerase family protein [Atopobiaceae bacterium]
MIDILGRNYSALDMRRFFGDASSIAGTRRFRLCDGKSRDCEIIEVSTGSGLVYEVNATRGMDLGRCSYRGIPLAYQSYDREVNSSYFDSADDAWLRNYAGGMLVTCGLRSIGTPGVDRGEHLPLHGRISNTPAERLSVDERFDDEGGVLSIRGSVRESKALDYNLVLSRTISSRIGTNVIDIDDTVENQGFETQELMVLYHFNIGHPILDQGAKLMHDSLSVRPRDRNADRQPEPFDEYLAPTPHYKDIVYYHRLRPSEDGVCTIGIANERIGMGLMLTFELDELDCLTQWKFLGEGNYVAGIEPGNAFVDGRAAERRKGNVKTIGPQEKRHFGIRLEILTSAEEIEVLKRATNTEEELS